VDSHESDISPGSSAEAGAAPSATGGPGRTRPSRDYADSPQADAEQPIDPVPEPAPAGTGTDYAGTGYASQATAAEDSAAEDSAADDSAAGLGGRPEADETGTPSGSRHGGDGPDEAFAEADVVVLQTRERAGFPDSKGSVTDARAAGGGAERWSEIKAMFVDDPRASVNRASGLAERAIEDLTAAVRKRHDWLSSYWQNADDATATEQLRRALQGYRALFEQLDQMFSQFVTEQATASPDA